MTIHGLSVHLHTGILVIALILALLCMVIRLITFLYPRWGLIRGIFTDWDFTKKIWNNRVSIFKAMDYATVACILAGVVGLFIGIYTGGVAINWDFSVGDVNRAKMILSLYALLFYGIALIIRIIPNMWRNPGLVVLYGLAIGFGFFFIFLDGAVGGIMVYGESIAEPILHWLNDLGFFNTLGVPDLLSGLGMI
ncbi:MAG: hypothetical protein HWN65_07875 [Candidatus Helarchaeota archaeon]|nr:hypothetical protein [Candidatus Helarchaeota archaeon]